MITQTVQVSDISGDPNAATSTIGSRPVWDAVVRPDKVKRFRPPLHHKSKGG